MTNTLKEKAFPAKVLISFYGLIEPLEKMAEDKDPFMSSYAKNLLEEVRKHPELIDGFEDFSLLDEHKELIEKLLRTVFPDALQLNEIKGVIPPFQFDPFYISERFKNILEDSGGYKFELEGVDDDKMYLYGCFSILAGHYGYRLGQSVPMHADIPSLSTNSIRTYRMAFNGDLMQMTPTEDSIEITEEIIHELLDNFEDIDLWKKYFPPGSWIMKGVGIANFMDVTVDRAINQINSNIMIKDSEAFEKVISDMKTLLNQPDLHVGFIHYYNNIFHAIPKEGMYSTILGNDEQMPCEGNISESTYTTLIKDRQPLVVSDASKFDQEVASTISKKILENGIGSFIIAPIVVEDEIIGFIELTCPEPYTLNQASLQMLDFVLPTISIAANRFKREAETLREAIIQQECTTIHPSVKWRFEEEADRFIAAQNKDEQPVFSDMIFKDVYPLYGQVDIKGSSAKRNEAVKADLSQQLNELKEILNVAIKKEYLPIYEELVFRIDTIKKKISKGLISGIEREVLSFLNNDIYPVFEHMKINRTLSKMIDKYFQSLNEEMGTVYNKRKEYDTSVNKINYTLATILDQEQVAAQEMFPHYFERFKTDGVEFDMYIGQSISKVKQYDPIYLQNLRLWQLIAMCKMEMHYHQLKEELNTTLDVTSLILVYNSSLSVHFRTDEKRFDVEGAYNARYEIVKKRIDKATVKGSPERITQPGKLAIVYSNDNDAIEYKKYLSFMENKGFIKKNSIETLEVEDLQGISGLWALRATYNYPNKEESADKFSVEKILEQIK